MIVATACSNTPTLNHENKPAPYSNAQLCTMWLEWCAKLGGIEETELFLLAPADYTPPTCVGAWKKFTYFRDRQNVAGWPYGPNSAFGQIAWNLFYRKTREPWLFCEPDCIPLRPTWVTEIADEYAKCGKPFMGGLVPGGPGYPEHMTGNAVYPGNSLDLAPTLVSEKKMNVAWDIRSAPKVMPQMAPTKLIFELYRHPPFKSIEELKAKVPETAVLFHSDKYGRIAELLSGGTENTEQTAGDNSSVIATPAAAPEQVIPRSQVYSMTELCELISLNVKSETARAKLMGFLYSKRFTQKNFGAAIKELATADAA